MKKDHTQCRVELLVATPHLSHNSAEDITTPLNRMLQYYTLYGVVRGVSRGYFKLQAPTYHIEDFGEIFTKFLLSSLRCGMCVLANTKELTILSSTFTSFFGEPTREDKCISFQTRDNTKIKLMYADFLEDSQVMLIG